MKTSRNRSAGVGSLALAMLALSACHHAPPQQQATKDAHDIALVQQAQHERPPVVPLQPGPINFAELGHRGDPLPLPSGAAMPRAGTSCTLRVGGTPVLVIVPQFGLARFAGRIEVFAADSGSAKIAGGLHHSYAGSAHTLELDSSGGSAQLRVRDRFDRVAYAGTGELTCPSASAAGSDSS